MRRMNEYISRDDALLHSEIIRVYSKDYGNIDVVPVEYLADIPAADVQPVKCGRWIWNSSPEFGNPYGSYICSECESKQAYQENFCPDCGARMEGEQNG